MVSGNTDFSFRYSAHSSAALGVEVLPRLVPVDGRVADFASASGRVGGGSAVLLRDVGGRQHVEAEEVSVQLQTVIDENPAEVTLLDERLQIVAVNRAWQRAARRGRQTGDEIGQDYLSLRWNGAGAAPKIARGLRQLLAGRRRRFSFAFERRGLGELRHYMLRASRMPAGGAPGIMIVHEDITDRVRFDDERQAWARRLLQCQSVERKRIARDLHDSTAQHLVAIGLSLKRLVPLAVDPADIDALKDIQDTLVVAHRELRTLSYFLHPPGLVHGQLVQALRSFVAGVASRTGLQIEFEPDCEELDLPFEHEVVLYRVAQEALTNVLKHAAARRATVRLYRRGARVWLQVEDDGVGFAWDKRQSAGQSLGVGVPGMAVRVRQIGGNLQICRKNRGTLVSARVPVNLKVIGRNLQEKEEDIVRRFYAVQ